MSTKVKEIINLYNLPINELIRKAVIIHHENFPEGDIELASLLSIKTGGCPEDCSYCPQSIKYTTGVKASKLMKLDEVIKAAKKAKSLGSNRFCMGAAWRELKDRDLGKITEMIREVKNLGLETCVTLGMITKKQAQSLCESGLDFYNHNLDTSEKFYSKIISTREYQERIDTINNVRQTGMSVCCGGIIGMGETREHRAELIANLSDLNPYPESVPINHLIPVKGTPLEKQQGVDPIEFVKTIAISRIMMPKSRVRLSAGRQELGKSIQAMCFIAGANSIFIGDKLLTTANPETHDDLKLLAELGLKPKINSISSETNC